MHYRIIKVSQAWVAGMVQNAYKRLGQLYTFIIKT